MSRGKWQGTAFILEHDDFEMLVRHSGKGKVGVQYTLEPMIQIRSGGVMNWESLSLRYYSNPGD